MNQLNLSVSYDTFQRELTHICDVIIQCVDESGIYVPPNMKNGVFTQFAMDNIDWREQTPDGSTFHATSSYESTPAEQQPPIAAQTCKT